MGKIQLNIHSIQKMSNLQLPGGASHGAAASTVSPSSQRGQSQG